MYGKPYRIPVAYGNLLYDVCWKVEGLKKFNYMPKMVLLFFKTAFN